VLIASFYFLLFFGVVLGVYYALPHRWRWLVLLVASYVFYISWSLKYAVVLLIMTAITFALARSIARQDNPAVKKRVLQVGLVVLFGVLGVFKYTNFFLSSVGGLLSLAGVHLDIPVLDIFFPVGISFFILQMVSYVVDVYKGVSQAESHFGKYALYIAFFPQLLIGPIERARHLLPQFSRPATFDYQVFVGGMIRIGWGFWKKLVIADHLAAAINTAFADPSAFSGPQLALAVLLYSLQIYADFSAYTDIVIGMASILGIKLTENFNHPYFATSPIDFWRRWHISLSTWLRDYLFFPLSMASRTSFTLMKQIRVAFLVFLFSGLWHGAAWTFVIWGGLHAFYQSGELILQRWSKARGGRRQPVVWRTVLGILVTFSLINFAWIFFRANSVADAFLIIQRIFTLQGSTSGTAIWEFATSFQRQMLIGLVLLFVALEFAQYFSKQTIWGWLQARPLVLRWTLSLVLVFSVMIFGYYGETSATAFIYAGF
jgi:D-alanyl-lipoteichoic acid acyltransferase DltB (MBOAT superfamily)